MDKSLLPLRREIGRRRIPGTHKVEIVYAVRDPNFPAIEHLQRVVILEKEESAQKTTQYHLTLPLQTTTHLDKHHKPHHH